MNINSVSDAPVAVMDSGVGGASVLRCLISLAPEENYIYFGDSANAPYGIRSEDEVMALSLSAARRLFDRGAKALVVACNTATSVAVDALREKYSSVPIIGMEPAIKPAALWGEHPSVLVMATPLTLRREKFLSLLHRYDSGAELCPLPCRGLVELIESGAESELIMSHLEVLFRPLLDAGRRFDAVVLGCTHYPLARDEISAVLHRLFGKKDSLPAVLPDAPRADAFAGDIAIFDGCRATANEALRRLDEKGLRRTSKQAGTTEIYSSSADCNSALLIERLIRAFPGCETANLRLCGVLR